MKLFVDGREAAVEREAGSPRTHASSSAALSVGASAFHSPPPVPRANHRTAPPVKGAGGCGGRAGGLEHGGDALAEER